MQWCWKRAAARDPHVPQLQWIVYQWESGRRYSQSDFFESKYHQSNQWLTFDKFEERTSKTIADFEDGSRNPTFGMVFGERPSTKRKNVVFIQGDDKMS